jgi:Transglycosylase-like domain
MPPWAHTPLGIQRQRGAIDAGRALTEVIEPVPRMPGKLRLAVSTCAVGLAVTAVAQAAPPDFGVVERPAERFERSIEIGKQIARYRDLRDQARALDVAPGPNPLAGDTGPAELRAAVRSLDRRVDAARREATSFDLAPGVSEATLEAIAACESGGDPTVVDASGTYYGKYQFDVSTWASVGGSGNPAEASEAEQDYRASLLYARAGSSPWPVCGQ